MADSPMEFGHRFAMHIILERMLAKMRDKDHAAFDALEAECMASVDLMPIEWLESENRLRTQHMSDSVQAIFSGARRVSEGR